MSKALILLLGLVACSLAMDTLNYRKEIAQREICRAEALESIQPELRKSVAEYAKVQCLRLRISRIPSSEPISREFSTRPRQRLMHVES